MAKPVFQYELSGEFVKKYESVAEASKATGIMAPSIHQAVRLNVQGKGYFWRSGEFEPKKNLARILIFDLETSPLIAYVWGVHKQYISPEQVIEDWKILTWAAKWLGEDEIMCDSVIKHSDELDDFGVVESMWHLLDEASMVIAHNGRKFDTKRINTRFLAHGMNPPSPYKTIDTLQIAKANFDISFNKLDYIAKFLKKKGKMENEGLEMWKKCMKGDKKAWEALLAYNIEDVRELEKVYLEFRPWDSRHPSVSIYNTDSELACTKCGSKNLEYIKDAYTNTRVYKLYQCRDCRGFSRSRVGINKKNTLMIQ